MGGHVSKQRAGLRFNTRKQVELVQTGFFSLLIKVARDIDLPSLKCVCVGVLCLLSIILINKLYGFFF